MNRNLLVVLLILGCIYANAQDYLRVLGRNIYTLNSDFYRLSMVFNGSAESLATKSSLVEKFKEAKLNVKIDTLTKDKIVIDINNIEDLKTLDSISYKQNAFPSISYVFKNESFEYQDNLALQAINNANEQANLLAKLMNKKIDGIVNIDDVVEKYLFYPEYYPTTECMKKAIVLVMEYFSTPEDPGKTEYDSNSKSGHYAIWVTYKLK